MRIGMCAVLSLAVMFLAAGSVRCGEESLPAGGSVVVKQAKRYAVNSPFSIAGREIRLNASTKDFRIFINAGGRLNISAGGILAIDSPTVVDLQNGGALTVGAGGRLELGKTSNDMLGVMKVGVLIRSGAVCDFLDGSGYDYSGDDNGRVVVYGGTMNVHEMKGESAKRLLATTSFLHNGILNLHAKVDGFNLNDLIGQYDYDGTVVLKAPGHKFEKLVDVRKSRLDVSDGGAAFMGAVISAHKDENAITTGKNTDFHWSVLGNLTVADGVTTFHKDAKYLAGGRYNADKGNYSALDSATLRTLPGATLVNKAELALLTHCAYSIGNAGTFINEAGMTFGRDNEDNGSRATTLENKAGGVLRNNGKMLFRGKTASWRGDISFLNEGTVVNAGVIEFDEYMAKYDGDGTIDNQGRIILRSGVRGWEKLLDATSRSGSGTVSLSGGVFGLQGNALRTAGALSIAPDARIVFDRRHSDKGLTISSLAAERVELGGALTAHRLCGLVITAPKVVFAATSSYAPYASAKSLGSVVKIEGDLEIRDGARLILPPDVTPAALKGEALILVTGNITGSFAPGTFNFTVKDVDEGKIITLEEANAGVAPSAAANPAPQAGSASRSTPADSARPAARETVESLLGEANVLTALGGPIAYARALPLYRQAAEAGNAEARYRVGQYYENGWGIAKSESEAAIWYRKAAEQGHAYAQIGLGYLHYNGQGVNQDYAEAAQWFRRAAEQGDAGAQYNLGVMYAHGEGVGQNDAEAVLWYQKSAEQGLADAQNNLGMMYKDGRGIGQDVAQAVRWYRKAAEQGNANAQMNLGFAYAHGEGVGQDYAQAVQWYRKAAEQGNVRAQFNLGIMYANGEGVGQDDAQAVQWYRKAAERGHADAQNNLGVMHANGSGVGQDDAEAVQWYRKAAEQGHAVAQNNLGAMYGTGSGVSQDDAEAVQWYRKAAEQGHADAQYNLGIMYDNGRGTVQDYAEAVQWYRKAAEQGHAGALEVLRSRQMEAVSAGSGVPAGSAPPPQKTARESAESMLEQAGKLDEQKEYARALPLYRQAAEDGNAEAQYIVGRYYAEGRGIAESGSDAAAWYRQAAEQGHVGAQVGLGFMYAVGESVDRDNAQAIHWFRKAAEQGNANAQNMLGYHYNYGQGVEQDHAQAVQWYRRAAEQGDDTAQHNLGSMYENGEGVDQDYAEATQWYRRAAEQGLFSAQNKLGYFYANGRGVDQDYEQAFQWYRKAAEQGHAHAQFTLGAMYANGEGVGQDYAQALQWYQKAAEQGHAGAQYNLGIMYRNGEGVGRDAAEAVLWYRKAAEQGHANAQYNLAFHYANGQGVDQDDAQAVQWLRKAAEQGVVEAQYRLGVMYANGEGIGQDDAQASQWLRKAAEQGHADAQEALRSRYGD